MSGGGFYLMHRGWQDNTVFGREAYDRRSAWVWLIEHAAYRQTSARVGGRDVELERGQLSYSLRFLADAWGWGHERVRRFVSELSRRGMTVTAIETGQYVITICNYNLYQVVADQDETPIETAARQQRDSSETNKKEGKEVKEEDTSEARASDSSKPRGGSDIAVEMTRIWNEECGSISEARKPNHARAAKCAARWRDSFSGSAEHWRAYCQRIAASPHLRGENERGWRADLEWVLEPSHFTRILEGRYDPRSGRTALSAADKLIEGFGRAAGLDDFGQTDPEPDRSSSGPLLDGEYARYDA